MTQYFIQTDAGQEGPFSLGELKTKGLYPQTPVWYEGINDWTAAGKIEALKDIATAARPPAFNKFAPRYGDLRRRFNLSLFQWSAIAAVIVSAFLYFSKAGDASPSGPTATSTVAEARSKVAAAAAEKEKLLIRAKKAARNKSYRNNWNRYIRARAGKYKKGMFGGINSLEAIVENKTEYPLEAVIMSVSYIKENGEIYKTEFLPLYNVPAHGKGLVAAPESSRGTSVRIEIIQVSSRSMNFLYLNEIEAKGKEDPYFNKY